MVGAQLNIGSHGNSVSPGSECFIQGQQGKGSSSQLCYLYVGPEPRQSNHQESALAAKSCPYSVINISFPLSYLHATQSEGWHCANLNSALRNEWALILTETLNSRDIWIKGYCADLAQFLSQVQKLESDLGSYLETWLHFLLDLTSTTLSGDAGSTWCIASTLTKRSLPLDVQPVLTLPIASLPTVAGWTSALLHRQHSVWYHPGKNILWVYLEHSSNSSLPSASQTTHPPVFDS